MGILRSGILGHMSGKTAGVVGSKWKDRSYIREYVIPANPNTTPQQTQRGRMRDCVAFCKPLVGQIFNKYGDKFQKGMSGFNYFIKQNIAIFDGSPAYSQTKITFGKLWMATIATATRVTTTLTMTWDINSLGNNGALLDHVYGAAYNIATGLWYFPAAEVARQAGTITITIPAGMTDPNIVCYLFAAKYSVTSPTLLEMVSDSSESALTS
jgi:hypothetical protein